MLVTPVSRTDRLLREVLAQLERHRPILDGPGAFSAVTIIVSLHPEGRVRKVQVRLDSESPSLDAQERPR